MQQIFEILERAAQTCETLFVTSAVGSTPLQPVELKVVEVLRTELKFIVKKPGSDETTKYGTKFVLWIDDASGKRYLNLPAIAAHEAHNQRKRAAAEVTAALRDDVGSFVNSGDFEIIQELSGTLNGEDKTFYAIRNKRTGAAALIYAVDSAHACRICSIFSTSQGVWDVIDVFMRAEFLWPVWIRMHDDVRDEAEQLINGMPRLADSTFDTSRTDILESGWEYKRKQFYVNRNAGFNLDERFGFFDEVAYLESSDIDYKKMFDFAKTLCSDVLRLYITKAWASSEKFKNHGGTTSKEVQNLRSAGLVQLARDADIDFVIRNVCLAELRKVAKAHNISLKSNGRALFIDYFKANMTPKLELSLRAASTPGLHIYKPPPGLTWQQLQDFRYCYVLMIRSLEDWLQGRTQGTTAIEYYKKFV